MKTIDTLGVLALHNLLVEKTGGGDGIREQGLLDSAVYSPYQTFGDIELYPTLIEKGARLGYALVSNHAFIDGNKRIGLLAMLTFFELNGITLDFTNDELISLGLSLAQGETDYDGLCAWLKCHQK